MVAPKSFDSLHEIKVEKPLIDLPLSLAYPVDAVCMLILSEKTNL
jgi:hypothetical protein